MKHSSSKSIGVIGAGQFGLAIANIIARKRKVMLYARKEEVVKQIESTRIHKGHNLSGRIEPTNDIVQLAHCCDVIFPIVPSNFFREMIREISPHLHPYHILIHGTKGLGIQLPHGETLKEIKTIEREHIKTMSEIIQEDSVVVRVGCLAGPNLSKELAEQQPSATVVASPFQEVIQIGKRLLRNDRFQVYENKDLIGVEMAGILKNIISIAAGALNGMGYGENSKGLLISRGLVEMIHIGKALGVDLNAFLGLAGIGDLVTTCNSSMSRNFMVGYQLAQGATLKEISSNMKETAEGVNTVRIINKFANQYNIKAPITTQLYQVLFEGKTIREGLQYLMNYPLNVDIDFL